MKKAVFCVHIGRAASTYLYRLLDCALDGRGWCVRGEDHPSLFGCRGDEEKIMDGVLARKEMFDSHAGFFETSHSFAKNFWECALDVFGDDIYLCYLIRDPLHVAASFMNWGSFPFHNKLKDYHIKTSKYLSYRESWSNYQRALWEWFEVHRVGLDMLEVVGEDRSFVFPFTEVSNSETYKSLFSWIGEDVPVPDLGDFAKNASEKKEGSYKVSLEDNGLSEAVSFYKKLSESEKLVVKKVVSEYKNYLSSSEFVELVLG